ncbi:MAG: hypothetical protein AAGA48_36135 [Myxococcota bacterium]
MTSDAQYVRTMGVFAVIAVVAWAAFAWTYRTFFPVAVSHGDPLGIWWLWLLGGTVGFIVLFEACSRALAVPSSWRLPAAVAATAPALVCDVLTGTQPQWWLAGAGEAADARYLALIVGGVGVLQLYAMLTSPPPGPTTR